MCRMTYVPVCLTVMGVNAEGGRVKVIERMDIVWY